MTRDDLKAFRALDIDFESIGLLQSGHIWESGLASRQKSTKDRNSRKSPATGRTYFPSSPMAGSTQYTLSSPGRRMKCTPSQPILSDEYYDTLGIERE